MKLRIGCVVVGFLSLSLFVFAQTPSSNNPPTSLASAQVPRLIRFLGLAKDATGKSLTGVVGITFSLYHDQQGGAPLWTETQKRQAQANKGAAWASKVYYASIFKQAEGRSSTRQ